MSGKSLPPPADLSSLIPLGQAAALFPILRDGKRPSPNLIWRWATRGTRGVKLAAWRVGRTLVTSESAVRDFISRSTEAGESQEVNQPTPARSSAVGGKPDPSIEARVAAARAKLKSLGC